MGSIPPGCGMSFMHFNCARPAVPTRQECAVLLTSRSSGSSEGSGRRKFSIAVLQQQHTTCMRHTCDADAQTHAKFDPSPWVWTQEVPNASPAATDRSSKTSRTQSQDEYNAGSNCTLFQLENAAAQCCMVTVRYYAVKSVLCIGKHQHCLPHQQPPWK